MTLMSNPDLVRDVAFSDVMSDPASIRNVAVVGHWDHGKTEVVDLLYVHAHHVSKLEPQFCSPYTRHIDESRIQYQFKLASLVLRGSNSTYLFNIMDSPGHVDFSDEMSAALRLADGAVLIIDAVQGVMVNTGRAIRHAIQECIPIVLVITKVDKLINELELPPKDAYFKLKDIVQTVNSQITAASASAGKAQVIDPALGNVCFASARDEWFFTLQSFAKLYVKLHRIDYDADKFASQLWGDLYFDNDTRSFKETPHANGVERSFVECVLESVYKMYSRKEERSAVFGAATAFTDMLVHHIPSPKDAAIRKVEHIYTGPKDSAIYKAMRDFDSTGPLMVNVTKLYLRNGCFYALGRVYSGEIMTGETVRVLREDEPCDSEEVMTVREVKKLWVCQACCEIPVMKAPPGSLVLIGGVDDAIEKTATLCNLKSDEDVYRFRPLQFNILPIVKISFSLLNGLRLSEILAGLRKISKTYILAILNVDEESGVCTILGTSELYLRYITEDVRKINSKVELEVAEHVVPFRETVVGSSSMNFIAETPNGRNRITMIAAARTGKYEWDLSAAQSFWEFGPDKQGLNILVYDIPSSEVDKNLLNAVKDYIVQGLQCGAQEGPLCHEPIRDVKFSIVDAMIAPNSSDHGMNEIKQTVQRAAHSAFLMAAPRLMEPVYYVEIQTPMTYLSAIRTVLSHRRGHVTADIPQPGTPAYIVKALLPVTESFGFEADLRLLSQGQAFSVSVFDHWAIVPGDPLAKSMRLAQVRSWEDRLSMFEPNRNLAREFMVKTRRRKGMSENEHQEVP